MVTRMDGVEEEEGGGGGGGGGGGWRWRTLAVAMDGRQKKNRSQGASDEKRSRMTHA